MGIDISPENDRGVLKEIIKEGIGVETPQSSNIVTVHYTSYLEDGTLFDSSKDRGKPFTFELNSSMVIKAFDIGIATMKRGEVAILTCAPEYAYGQLGMAPSVPPDATLKFEIEMIDWKAKDLSPEGDGSIIQLHLSGPNQRPLPIRPVHGVSVNIHLVGIYNGNTFEERDVDFIIGQGEEYGIVKGVEIGLKKLRKGQEAKFAIKSKYAFGTEGKPEFNIPGDATVEYIVKLNDLQTDAAVLSLQLAKAIELAKTSKEQGTKYFKANKYKLAITMYQRARKILSYQTNYEDLKTEYESLKLSIHLNLALCYLKIDKNVKAKDECNEALKLSPQNEKAFFRRAQAYLALASPELAMQDFQEVLRIEPKNTVATKQIAICNNHIQKQLTKEKKLYANMFDKFAQEDKQKEEEKQKEQPDVMKGTLGEWGQEERPGGRDATAFEKENPNILMLNANGTGEFQNM